MSESRGPLAELTIARFKEFIREPEAIFWVFAFPMLLTLALGFAFREKPPDRILVGVVEGPQAQARMQSLSKSPALQPRILAEAAARDELRRGKISILVEGGNPPLYRYDPTRPDARAARLEVDDALQSAAGRRNAFASREEHVKEQGSRY